MTMTRFILFDGNVLGLATQGRILLAGTSDAEWRGSLRATDFRLQLLFSRAIGSAAALCCSLTIEIELRKSTAGPGLAAVARSGWPRRAITFRALMVRVSLRFEKISNGLSGYDHAAWWPVQSFESLQVLQENENLM